MSKRNVGLDLCRIISMLGIVVIHIIEKGGAHQVVDGTYTANYWLAEWLYICALSTVDVFAIMSGYFGINKKTSSTFRTLELISIVLFFCSIITVCFVVYSPGEFLEIKSIIKGILPAIDNRYWYITSYIPILILQPFINRMVLSLSEKQHLVMCILLFVVFTIAPTVLMKDFFDFDRGYSFAWLLCLYIFGVYLRRNETERYKISKKYLAISVFIMSIILLFGNLLVESVLGSNYRYFVAYDSPICLLMSVFVFLLFENSNIKIKGGILEQISFVAFDVYIVHVHIFIYDYIIKDSFTWISDMAAYLVVPMILLSSIAIYIICTIIGLIRAKLFKITGLNNLMLKFSKLIDKVVYADILKEHS